MAQQRIPSVKQRGRKFYFVTDDPNNLPDERKQVYHSFDTREEATAALAEWITSKLKREKPKLYSSKMTIAQFVPEFIAIYGQLNWGPKTYSTYTGLLKNHIVGEIGQLRVKNVTPKDIESWLIRLKAKKCSGAKSSGKEPDDVPPLSAKTVREVFDLMSKLFEKAVEWELRESSPVLCKRPTVGKKDKEKVASWNGAQIAIAFNHLRGDYDNEVLYLMCLTAFVTTTRNGEVGGLQWDRVHFDYPGTNHGVLYVDRTLERVDKEALIRLNQKEVLFTFPEKTPNTRSTLVLKNPKTEESERYVLMNRELSERLFHRKQQVLKEKAFFGGHYNDYDLVFCLPNGDPVEPNIAQKRFKKWQKRSGLGLPLITVHGIRHTSISYKLKVTADLASVQSDAGHADIRTTGGYLRSADIEDKVEILDVFDDDFTRLSAGERVSVGQSSMTAGKMLEVFKYAAAHNIEQGSLSVDAFIAYTCAHMEKSRAERAPSLRHLPPASRNSHITQQKLVSNS